VVVMKSLLIGKRIKKTEKLHKHRESVLDGIPHAMPPLEKAYKIQNKVKNLILNLNLWKIVWKE